MSSSSAALGPGWFAIALSSQLERGRVHSAQLGDRRLTVFRDREGMVQALSSMCPYDGADLSSGKLRDGFLVCPFHGCRFDSEGRGSRSGSARLSRPLDKETCREVAGQVFVEQPGTEPGEFDRFLPRSELESMVWQGWATELSFDARRLHENAVDGEHYVWVHNSERFRWVSEPQFRRCTMECVYEVDQPLLFLGRRLAIAKVCLDMRLLYAHVALARTRTTLGPLAFDSVTVSALSPAADNRTRVFLTTAVARIAWDPTNVVSTVIRAAVHRESCKAFKQDFEIWRGLPQQAVDSQFAGSDSFVPRAREWAASHVKMAIENVGHGSGACGR